MVGWYGSRLGVASDSTSSRQVGSIPSPPIEEEPAMKKTTALLMTGMLLLTACGDDDAGALDTCEGVADATIALVQDVIDEFEALTPSEASDVMSGQMTPAF